MILDDLPVQARVIPPLLVTDALLTSSTVVETAPTAYNGATTYAAGDTASVAGAAGLITVYESLQSANTGNAPESSPDWWKSRGQTYQAYSGAVTYALGDRVINAAAHLVYESLAAGNSGNALTDVTKWLKIGRTNRAAMFDLTTSQATSCPSPLTVVVTPGQRRDALALDGLVGNALEITQTVDGVEKFAETIDLNTREVANYTDFFFQPFSNKGALVRYTIPPFTDGVLTVSLTSTSGDVQCRHFVIGRHDALGSCQREVRIGGQNYSTITRDFDSNINTIVARRTVPKINSRIFTSPARVTRVKKLKETLNAVPAHYALLDVTASRYFEVTQMVGIYKGFELDLSQTGIAVIELETEAI
jgi:hypothetical protein